MPSFTSQLPNLHLGGPVVETTLALHAAAEDVLRQQGRPIPVPLRVQALIDTGATSTVIKEGLVSQLNLQPVGVVKINTASSINVQSYRYPIRFILPNNIEGEAIVIAAPLQGQNIQCLIGRDILSRAVLVYIGYANMFSLSL